MKGYIDLHCHCLPGVDDGAQTVEESIRLCRSLFRLGFDIVVATPHMRPPMFENTRWQLEAAYQALLSNMKGVPELPRIKLAAEHFFNDVFWERLERGEVLPYTGGAFILIEFPIERLPIDIENRLFRMNVRGIHPVLAHPERYLPLRKSSQPIKRLLETGLLTMIDIKALGGKLGARIRRVAERMLEEGVFFAVTSDSHQPEDIPFVEKGLERLFSMVGEEQFYQLLIDNPKKLLTSDSQDRGR